MLVSMHLCVWVCVCVCVYLFVCVCVCVLCVCMCCNSVCVCLVQGNISGGGGGQYNGTVLLHLIDQRQPHNEVVMEQPMLSLKVGIHGATSCRFVACNSNEYGQMFRKPSVN